MITVDDNKIEVRGTRMEIASELVALAVNVAKNDPTMFVAISTGIIDVAEHALESCDKALAVKLGEVIFRCIREHE